MGKSEKQITQSFLTPAGRMRRSGQMQLTPLNLDIQPFNGAQLFHKPAGLFCANDSVPLFQMQYQSRFCRCRAGIQQYQPEAMTGFCRSRSHAQPYAGIIHPDKLACLPPFMRQNSVKFPVLSIAMLIEIGKCLQINRP